MRRRAYGLYELFCLAPCCAVADGYGLYAVLLHERGDFPHGLGAFVVRGMGVDGFVVQQVAVLVEAYYLAARAESGVYAHSAFLAERRGEKQLPQVRAENLYRLAVCTLLAERGELGLNRWLEQTLVSVPDSAAHYAGTFALRADENAVEAFDALFFVGRYVHAEYLLALSAPHSQKRVGRASRELYLLVEIVAVFAAFPLLAFYHTAVYHCPAGEYGADGMACRRTFAHPFGNDVHCAGDGRLCVSYLVVREALR